jgi:hypothetical protein
MISKCRRPVLILEGAGDIRVVPRLIRGHAAPTFDIRSKSSPKTELEYRDQKASLVRAGEFERYVEYGARDDTDSVLFVLDCEDVCPVDVCSEFTARILRMRIGKNMAYPPSTAAPAFHGGGPHGGASHEGTRCGPFARHKQLPCTRTGSAGAVAR